MKDPLNNWSRPQRQSAAALFIMLYNILLSFLKFLWPLLLVLLLKKRSAGVDSYEIAALGISVISLTASIVGYYNFRFHVVNNKLIIQKGFFIKKMIALPLEKIQTIHMERNWLHSLLNVSKLSFDSAGSEKMEVSIEALDNIKASALKTFILEQKNESVPSEENITAVNEEILITLSGRDLLKLCLTANHLKAFFLLLAFAFSIWENLGISDNDYNQALQWLSENVQADSVRLFLIFSVFIMIVSIGISVIRIVLMYSDFNISRSEKGFRIQSGLINKKENLFHLKKFSLFPGMRIGSGRN